jgi:hypothetical protein
MNNSTKSGDLKASEKKKRLETALKRNMLRRKEQSNQRSQADSKLTNIERGLNNDNVR